MPRERWLWLTLILMIGIFISGCQPIIDPMPLPHQLSAVEFDSIMVFGSDRMHRLSVRIDPAGAAQDREMLCQIRAEQVSTHFRLYNDGGVGVWFDAAGFADSLSGDLVPGDGIFTRRISSEFAARSGEYSLTFSLSDSPPPDSLNVTVHVIDNSEPIVHESTTPDSIHSGAAGLIFSATIDDADGSDDIITAEVVREGEIAVAFSMTRVGSLDWNWSSVLSIASGVPTGEYSFVVRTQDYYLNVIGDFAWGDPAICWLENGAPNVLSVDGPDTVWIRAGERTLFQYDIWVHDDQGTGDLDSLLLEISRSKDSNPDQDTVLKRILYYDIANELDSLTGDGIFVAGFSADTSNRLETVFTFRWIPTDKSPQRGEDFLTRMVILENEGVLSGIGENTAPVGNHQLKAYPMLW